MGVYFQIKDSPINSLTIDTTIITFNQYMEKRAFTAHTANSIMGGSKKSYWEAKNEENKKEKRKRLMKDKTYRQMVDKSHEDILKNFVETLKEK